MKYLRPQPLDVQQTDVFENPIKFWAFDLKKKFATSDKNLIGRLCEIVVYNVYNVVYIYI